MWAPPIRGCSRPRIPRRPRTRPPCGRSPIPPRGDARTVSECEKTRRAYRDGPSHRTVLDGLEARGLGPLRALGDLELDLLVLLKRGHSRILDLAETHEYVGTVLLNDEPEPLRGVEPLHS